MPEAIGHRTGAAPALRVLALELTRRCNLACAHCRMAPEGDGGEELSTGEVTGVLDAVAEIARPVLILSGGEPLTRLDVLEVVSRGAGLGMRVGLATNGWDLDRARAEELAAAGLSRLAISLDGATAASHDGLRGADGSFERALAAADASRAAGLPFQFNTTVRRGSAGELGAVARLAAERGAEELHFFFVVPCGRGRALAAEALGGGELRSALDSILAIDLAGGIPVKVTCAPQYEVTRRLAAGGASGGTPSRRRRGASCIAGVAYCFIGADGRVQPCGYLEETAGSVREAPFGEIWRGSQLLARLRDRAGLAPPCGGCPHGDVCGGCRARALHAAGSATAADPSCPYAPGDAR